MKRVKARTLLNYTTQDLWNNLQGSFIIVMDDGEIATNEKEVIYSSYVWRYHKLFPETPLLLKHLVGSAMAGKRMGTETHLDLINNSHWSVYDTYKARVPDKLDLIDDLNKLAYEISNEMYNDLSYKLEEYVTSLDILDFIRITKDSKVVNALSVMEMTEEGITKVQNVIMDLINTPEMSDNPMANAINSRIVSKGQALQCLGPRGFLTDIDSNVFNAAPIKSSYTKGIATMYDNMIESRSSAKSLIFSTDPLQQSEYFSRRQQLICQNVKTLHLVDCGSKHYLTWSVRGKRTEGANEIVSDLVTLAGKYYLDEQSNTLKIIKQDDRHLEGKVLKLRSPIAGCMHPDPTGICEVCYGETALSIPKNSNLGHITCVAMTSDLGQLILSTKHFDGSSVVEWITLKTSEKRFLSTTVNGTSYYLNSSLKGKKVELIVNSNQANRLTDINLVNDIDTLNLARISEFESIVVHVTELDDGEIEAAFLNVSLDGRNSNFTHAILKHIKKVGWSISQSSSNKETNYVIDMTGWDYSEPILVLPMRHYNMSMAQKEIAEMLESTMKEVDHRSNVASPQNVLVEFHDMVNRRLSINLSILEVILYSSMIVSVDNNDYSLPKPWTDSGLGVKAMLLTNRSLSATMCYERHRETITDPSSYIDTNRMNHVMDQILLPEILNK